MRELERDLPSPSATAQQAAIPALAVVGAGRVGSSLAAGGRAGRARGSPRGSRRRCSTPARVPRRCCSASPTRRSPRPPRRSRRRRRGCASPATRAAPRDSTRSTRSPPSGRGDVLASPAADRSRPRHRLHRLSRGDLRLDAGGARARPRACRPARDAPVRGPRRAARRLPRGRLDRLELPRRAGGIGGRRCSPRPALPTRASCSRRWSCAQPPTGRSAAPRRSPVRSRAATRPRSPGT